MLVLVTATPPAAQTSAIRQPSPLPDDSTPALENPLL